jgi:hypothetical protein
MAIASTFPVAFVATTSNLADYPATAFVPTANSLLVVIVFVSGSLTNGTVTGGGLTWTNQGRINVSASHELEIWTAPVGASPVSTTVNYNCTADPATGCLMGVWQVTGHNASNPIAQAKVVDLGTGVTNPTITLDQNMNTLNGYIVFGQVNRTTPASTPPTGWTEDFDSGIATPTVGGTGARRNGGETGNTVTFTSASAAWCMAFIEINEASVGGITRPKTMMLMGVGANRRRNLLSNLN